MWAFMCESDLQHQWRNMHIVWTAVNEKLNKVQRNKAGHVQGFLFFFGWCFNSWMTQNCQNCDTFIITFCAISSILVIAGSRNPSLKSDFVNRFCSLHPQQPLLAAVSRGLDLWAPPTSRKKLLQLMFKGEGKIVNRLVNQESGESGIGAASAPKVQTPGQRLLLLVGTEKWKCGKSMMSAEVGCGVSSALSDLGCLPGEALICDRSVNFSHTAGPWHPWVCVWCVCLCVCSSALCVCRCRKSCCRPVTVFAPQVGFRCCCSWGSYH